MTKFNKLTENVLDKMPELVNIIKLLAKFPSNKEIFPK